MTPKSLGADVKPLIIGMNNPYGAKPEYALYPLPRMSAGGRLYALIREATGLTRVQYRDQFDRINLVNGPWSAAAARSVARLMLRGGTFTGRHVVFLGRDVQMAFELNLADPCCQFLSTSFCSSRLPKGPPEFHGYALPHTSGRNHWWNDEVNRRRGLVLLRSLYNQVYPSPLVGSSEAKEESQTA